MAENYRNVIDLGLGRMHELMAQLQNPQNKIPVIQIAGTNGKGSTGTFIRMLLTALGFKVGHYSSPAVFEPMEIINIDGVNIERAEFDRLERKIMALPIYSSADVPTVFETETAAAYQYFAEKSCDFVIAEAGLGGDQDATNITEATIMSVFTPIGLDHTRLLGSTVAEIAGHKAGIIKPGCMVVTAPQVKEAMNVLKKAAENNLFTVAEPLNVRWGDGWTFDLPWIKDVQISMPAEYQVINMAAALAAVNELKKNGHLNKADDRKYTDIVKNTCQNAQIPGRMEVIHKDPVIIIDGAHNPPAAAALKNALDKAYPQEKRIFIFGAFRDKNFTEVVRTVCDGPIYTVTAPGPRGVPSEELAEILKSNGFEAKASDIEQAAETALGAEKDSIVVAFGSLSWIADFKKQVRRHYEDWKPGT